MPQLVAFYFVRDGRAWADDAHVAAQDVEKLRQLVKARPSQDTPQPRYSLVRAQLVRRPLAVSLIRIGLAFNVLSLKFAMLGIVDAGMHRAKFEEQKNAAIHAQSLLLIKNRSTRIQFNKQSNQQPERRQNQQRQRPYDQIGSAFDDASRARKRRAKQRNHGQRANLIDLGLARQTIQKGRRNAKFHAAPAPSLNHHIKQGFTRHARIGDDHLVRARFTNRFRQTL